MYTTHCINLYLYKLYILSHKFKEHLTCPTFTMQYDQREALCDLIQ